MILTRLKDHLVANGKTSRAELAKKFAISEDGIDAMLALWVAKGKVSTTVSERPRLGQVNCDVWYRWNDENELAITVLN
ncbi:MAG: FeoC-like transcriptional regulator [Moritella sp.]|uniref:FeoC-like transcriptional regulator n=1 Tax=Moritella sp. TaxID=78556 RepID=UPI0029AAF1D6|nr:FeoC-like transcriptional regulator [Moritella sp.]MDX2322024.1 FeoC-like transcriptional regulator [Moritella sp.]